MAEIGGHLAHQLPLHNHNQTGLQPSLVMNHHLDLDCHGHDVISEYTFQNLTLEQQKKNPKLCHDIAKIYQRLQFAVGKSINFAIFFFLLPAMSNSFTLVKIYN